jgi:hypothetical protein
MFEFRLRVLQAGPNSFLGLVEGFPSVLAHAESASAAEGDLVRALIAHLEAIQDPDGTRIQLDDLPTIRRVSIFVRPAEV